MKPYSLYYILLLGLLIPQFLSGQTIAELNSKITALREKGDYEGAIPLAKQVVQQAKAHALDTTYAETLNDCAELYYYTGRYKDAETLFIQSKNLRKKLLGTEDPEYAASLNNLGLTYSTMGRYEEAEPLLLEAVRIWKKAWGTQHPHVAAALNNIALLYERLGKYKKAAPVYKETIKIMEATEGKKSYKYSNTLSNLAGLYHSMGELDKAEELALEVLTLKAEVNGKSHPLYAKALNNLAMIYYAKGELEEAIPLYKEALTTLANSLGKEHITYARTLNSLAAVYYRMNKYAKALAYYKTSLNIRKKTVGVKHPSYAIILNNMAKTYQILNDYEQAKSYYKQASEIQKAKFGTAHPQYAISLRNLGRVALNAREFKAARSYFQQALAILKEIHSERHPDVIITTAYLGEVALVTHQLDACREYLDKAIQLNIDHRSLPHTIDEQWKAILINATPSSHLHLLKTLSYLYHLERMHYEHTHDVDQLMEAKMVTRTALDIAENYRQNFVSEGNKLKVLEESVAWAYKAIQNSIEIAEQQKLKEFHNKAFQYAEQSKSVLLTEAVQGDKAHVFGDLPDSLVAYEKELQEKQAALRAQLLEITDTPTKNNIRAQLNQLNIKIKQFKERIAQDYPKYNALKYSHNPITTEHIQELLDNETAMIEYVVADTVVYLFSVDKKHFELYHIPIKKSLLTQKIKDLRKALSNYAFIRKKPKEAYKLYHQTAFWFYDNLLEPAIHHEEIKHLLIIPDGELGHLPFEAFLTAAVNSKKPNYQDLPYLVNDFKISYDFSASLWDENESDHDKAEQAKNYEKVLACAASYHTATKKITSKRSRKGASIRKSLVPLPAAEEEVKILADKFDGTFLIGEAANERFFKENASEYGIIHLAMHGLLDINHPVLSSLAFTENNDSIEDNFLKAYEIAHMHLHAQLVVLSACETGYGKFEQGEGVISLARAFMYAGVPSLVVSMWAVNDKSTAHIMNFFYDNLAEGMDKAAALQQAKINYLKRADGIAAHPAYWAPFIQLGDHHPVHLHRKGGSLRYWIIGGLVLLVLIGVGYFLMNYYKKAAVTR